MNRMKIIGHANEGTHRTALFDPLSQWHLDYSNTPLLIKSKAFQRAFYNDLS